MAWEYTSEETVFGRNLLVEDHWPEDRMTVSFVSHNGARVSVEARTVGQAAEDLAEMVRCPVCMGTRTVDGYPCFRCKGRGYSL